MMKAPRQHSNQDLGSGASPSGLLGLPTLTDSREKNPHLGPYWRHAAWNLAWNLAWSLEG